MKPCSKNRKKITWLTLNALDAAEERQLRSHLENCPGCRAYWTQVSALTDQLSTARQLGALETSERFHQQVVRAVRKDSPNWIDGLFTRWPSFSWRWALPVAGLALVVVAVLSWGLEHPQTARKSLAELPSRPAIPVDLEPTVFNYQMVANASLERLDDLLTSQGNRNPPPGSRFPGQASAGAPTME